MHFYDWAGNDWVVLFSHPADYTPVCTTELGNVAKLKSEFAKRNAKVIALSVDSVESHQGWISDINQTQSTTVNYPIIADEDKSVSDLYGMIHPNANAKMTVRTVFLIDPSKKLRLTITYPPVPSGISTKFCGCSTHCSSLTTTAWPLRSIGRTARMLSCAFHFYPRCPAEVP